MVVKNEAVHLPACLDSVKTLAGEIVIVDTGSSDGTQEIARRYGARVIPFDFSFVDFSAARNAGISQAKGNWIFSLDADETLDPAGISLIEQLAAGNENSGYYVARRNRSADPNAFTTDYIVRLFPNRRDYRYQGRVHETIDAAILAGGGRLRKTAICIDHNFSSNPESRQRRNRWYIQILKEEIAANPKDDTRLDFLAAEYHQLEMFDEATEVAEQIVRARPLDPAAHLRAGIYHLMFRPDFIKARKDFEEALRLRPGYPEALSFLQTLEERERSLTSGAV
jgi:glycosyltransferase involved in cell wall biosynthesis